MVIFNLRVLYILSTLVNERGNNKVAYYLLNVKRKLFHNLKFFYFSCCQVNSVGLLCASMELYSLGAEYWYCTGKFYVLYFVSLPFPRDFFKLHFTALIAKFTFAGKLLNFSHQFDGKIPFVSWMFYTISIVWILFNSIVVWLAILNKQFHLILLANLQYDWPVSLFELFIVQLFLSNKFSKWKYIILTIKCCYIQL